MRKYVDDAEKVMAAELYRKQRLQRRRQAAEIRNRILKMSLLGVAFVGVAAGLYFAHDLGGIVATNVGSSHGDSTPAVEPPPPSKAKLLRKLAESHQSRENDLEEIENF